MRRLLAVLCFLVQLVEVLAGCAAAGVTLLLLGAGLVDVFTRFGFLGLVVFVIGCCTPSALIYLCTPECEKGPEPPLYEFLQLLGRIALVVTTITGSLVLAAWYYIGTQIKRYGHQRVRMPDASNYAHLLGVFGPIVILGLVLLYCSLFPPPSSTARRCFPPFLSAEEQEIVACLLEAYPRA